METTKRTIAEIKAAIEVELGFAVQLHPNSDVFATLLNSDFDTVLPNENVRGLDKLTDMVLTLSEKDHKDDAETIAKHLVDGVWARIRSIEYSAKTKADKATAMKAAQLEENKKKYFKLIGENPSLLDNPETNLNLQRTYGVIDQATYELMLAQHRKLAAAIKAAEEQAKATVLASQGKEPIKKAA